MLEMVLFTAQHNILHISRAFCNFSDRSEMKSATDNFTTKDYIHLNLLDVLVSTKALPSSHSD